MTFLKQTLFSLVFMFISLTLHAETLTIGTLIYNPPFEVESNHAFFGFDISLMQEVCKRMQSECYFKGLLFENLSARLLSRDIDVAIGAIIITPERKKKFLFSLPYKKSYLQFLTHVSSSFPTIKSLHGKTVGIYFDSPSIPLIDKFYNHDINIKPYRHSMDMYEALNSKEIDAILTNKSQAIFWISNNPNFKLVGEPFSMGEGYGIMTQKNRQALIDKINQALIAIENDGTYLKIYSSSFE